MSSNTSLHQKKTILLFHCEKILLEICLHWNSFFLKKFSSLKLIFFRSVSGFLLVFWHRNNFSFIGFFSVVQLSSCLIKRTETNRAEFFVDGKYQKFEQKILVEQIKRKKKIHGNKFKFTKEFQRWSIKTRKSWIRTKFIQATFFYRKHVQFSDTKLKTSTKTMKC